MFQNTTLGQTVANLRTALNAAKLLAEAETRIGGIAALGLIAAVESALADLAEVRMNQMRGELARRLPPIAGGCPDDFEILDEAIFGDEWPEYPDAELDGYVYETGPTPLSVLSADDPGIDASRDWDSYFDLLSQEIREEDLMAAGLAVG